MSESRHRHDERTAPGRGGLPRVILAYPAGGRVEVYLHGAHVTSWTGADGEPLLFLSERSRFEPGAAIRGGIPVIFPQFADRGPLPKHGFARTMRWELAETEADLGGAATALLRLRDDESTRALWPHPFRAELFVALDEALTLTLRVENPGDTDFEFTTALHTYLRVGDVRRATVEGLRGVAYVDKVEDRTRKVEEADAVAITGETDRVYEGAPDRLVVRDPAAGRTLVVEKEGFPDAVVWNPWTELAHELPDLGDDEYLRMLCVESAAVATPVRLAPGGEWRGTVRLRVER